MKSRLSLLVATAITSLTISQNIQAAAYQFYELGTPIIGTAGVGQAVVAYDASIAYYNPAGMASLERSHFMVGAQALLPYINFSKQHGSIHGDNGGNAATLTPGIDLYYVYSLSPCWKLGVSFTSPYGGLLNYNNGWVGRYIVQNLQLYAVDLNPVVSYTINDKFAIGLGVVVEYANLYQTVALPRLLLDDGQATIKVGNTNMGFNAGLYWAPRPCTKIGLAYRSQIKHKMRGDTTFLHIGITPNTSAKMTMPQSVIASIAQDVSCRLTLLGELGWANWTAMKKTTLNVAGFTANTILDWKNTYRLGLGAQFKATPALLLQLGASYDSSPTTAKRRTPDLPADKQVRIGTGFVYSVYQMARIGVSYEYLNFGRAPINNKSILGTFNGNYRRNYTNVVQASIDVDL